MRMTLTVSYAGNGYYDLSLDSHWLTMPKTRSTDSLGICIENHSVVWESRGGHISYNRVNNIKGYDRVETEGLLPSAFHMTSLDSWRGVAVVFNLKNDWAFGDKFFNYKAHIEFKTVVSQPDQALNFNVVGVYHHMETKLSIDDVTISMDTTGTFGISIGISIKEYET